MNVFPETQFSQSELYEIQEALSLPSVVKYLHSLAFNAGKDIALSQKDSAETADDYLRRIEHVKGSISIIDMLLQIKEDKILSDQLRIG